MKRLRFFFFFVFLHPPLHRPNVITQGRLVPPFLPSPRRLQVYAIGFSIFFSSFLHFHQYFPNISVICRLKIGNKYLLMLILYICRRDFFEIYRYLHKFMGLEISNLDFFPDAPTHEVSVNFRKKSSLCENAI